MARINYGSFLNFFLFIFLVLGIVTASQFPLFLIFACFSFGAVFLSYLSYRKNKLFLSDSLILILFFFLGATSYLAATAQKPDAFLKQEKEFVLKVITLPKPTSRRNSFTGQIKAVSGHSFKQKVKVWDYTKSLTYLNSYEISGKLSRRKYHNRWFYYLWIKSKAKARELPLGLGAKFAKESTSYILDTFKQNSTDQAYRFLAAVFLGRRELLGPERESFSQAGVSHLLAISGMHIGITSLILFFFLGFFGLSFRRRLSFSLAFLYLYTFLTGASPSTLRAVIMYSVFAFSFFLERRPHSLNSLGLSGLVCLLTDPSMLFSVGFQLSFAAVFAIIVGHKLFSLKLTGNQIVVYSKGILLCSLFVTILITPLVSYYFGQVNLLSIAYNVIVIPFFTFILAINFLLLIFSPLAFIAQSLGALLSFLIASFLGFVRFLSSFKFSYFSYQFSLKAVFSYYLLLTFIVLGLRRMLHLRGEVPRR